MNIWKGVILPVLTGRKTITKFTAGGFNVELAILPGESDFRKFDKDHMTSALKDALRVAIADYVAKHGQEPRNGQ